MATASITVRPYDGGLIAAQLLSPATTIALVSFGGAQTGTLTDDDGILGNPGAGATYNGHPVSYVGSGTAQAGINVLGVTIPFGPAVPLVVFQAGGQTYFHFPQGEPGALSGVAMVVNLTPAPYRVFTPVCFLRGTLIDTPDGPRPVETLAPGDLVRDHRGRAEEVLWTGGRRLELAMGLSADYARWLPVRIARGAFGPGLPDRDLWLSQQHRVLVAAARAELLFGAPEVLVPARGLAGMAGVTLDTGCRAVDYHHILCRRHVVLRANGLPAESLYLGDMSARHPDVAAAQEALALFPGLLAECRRMRMAFPALRMREARLLRAA